MNDNDSIKRAFLAGFMASTEGQNGDRCRRLEMDSTQVWFMIAKRYQKYIDGEPVFPSPIPPPPIPETNY